MSNPANHYKEPKMTQTPKPMWSKTGSASFCHPLDEIILEKCRKLETRKWIVSWYETDHSYDTIAKYDCVILKLVNDTNQHCLDYPSTVHLDKNS